MAVGHGGNVRRRTLQWSTDMDDLSRPLKKGGGTGDNSPFRGRRKESLIVIDAFRVHIQFVHTYEKH